MLQINECQKALRMKIKGVAIFMEMLILSMPSLALPPIIKWAGGKERELAYIKDNAPKEYDRYFEPFVGGGAVFSAVSAREYLINDKSDELMALYMAIKEGDKTTFQFMSEINSSWKAMLAFANRRMEELIKIYHDYQQLDRGDQEVSKDIDKFIRANIGEINAALGRMLYDQDQLYKELSRNVTQKFMRMRKIERQRKVMPASDLEDNIRTAFMGSLYMYYRYLYNKRGDNESQLNTALFVFIRNFAYSGMFRYNAKGEFNVPYGGIGYNSKTLDKKIRYYQSLELADHFRNATIENLDFLDFFRKHPPTRKDFIFLDPPYDSEFSTYANNAFGKEDQQRLAAYLTEECEGKWLMIIKNTPFIYSLYDKPGLKIRMFDKKYQVSFMNRNDKDVEHLIITNY